MNAPGHRRRVELNGRRRERVNQEGKNMREMRTRLFNFFAAALILAAALSISAAAQEKGKEAQKPAASTIDAWRQALPPQAETEGTPDASAAAAAQPRASREEMEAALTALERKWMGALQQRDASALSQLISRRLHARQPAARRRRGRQGQILSARHA